MRKGKSVDGVRALAGMVDSEWGWRGECLLPGITAGNALCLSLNRPGQEGVITVNERLAGAS